jgi:hypothetical protein
METEANVRASRPQNYDPLSLSLQE